MKKLDIDLHVIKDYIKSKEYSLLASYLKKIFALPKDQQGLPLKYEFSKNALNALVDLLKLFESEGLVQSETDLLKEIFRALRNYVINTDVQNYLITDSDFLHNTKKILHNATDGLLQIMLQFLINLIISNEKNTCKVYDFYQDEIILFLKEKRCSYEISALLYNISLYKSVESLDLECYLSVFNLFECDKKVEFLHFLLETFITYNNYWDYHLQIDLKFRIITLEIIREQQIQGKNVKLSAHAISILANQFVNSSNIIFQTAATSETNLEPYEVSLLLEILSSLCSNDDYLELLRNNKDLLINSGVLLINIHRLGKASENYFSSIEKLSELRQPSELIRQHPAFGFKAGLIRIIGNLCWKNPKMQDLVREAELIPVLLDCCNIDARNPFIMQWVILAIRNLCENNAKNQEFIAAMHKKGTVSSSTLQEMGLTLNSDSENTIKIIALDSLRNS